VDDEKADIGRRSETFRDYFPGRRTETADEGLASRNATIILPVPIGLGRKKNGRDEDVSMRNHLAA